VKTLKKSVRLIVAALLVALPILHVSAQQPTAAAVSQAGAAPKIQFEKYTLPNGLQVILHVDKKLPVVHVNQWFHVGSKNEKLNRTGFAHLFEHMMFQGSKNAAGEYFSYVEKAGANLFTGGVNGTTNNDRTNYFATVPSGNLEYILWLESDRLATLADALTKEKLDNQRDVVKNERRQSLENVPYGRAFKLIYENLHPKGHPYSWDVIGIHEDLTAASLEDVQEFFRTYYTPNNLSLVIAGDFDPAEAKRLVAKYFGPIPPGPALDRPGRNIPALTGEKVMEVNDRVPQERTYISWPTPPIYDQQDAELDIIANILTDGLASRLNKVLVYDKQIASDVSAFQNSQEISSFFTVIGTARPGASLAQIEQTITDEIARLAKSGPTAAELDRAKVKIEYQFVTNLERIGGFGGKADRLNSYNTFLGDPNKFEFDLNRYRGATVESVRATAARWLDTRNRLIVRFHPETSQRDPQAAELDRTKQPALGTDKQYVAPEVKSAKLENGLEVFVVERKELPKVAVELATKTGSVTDPAQKAGLARLAYQTMDMGTKTRNALEIEQSLGDLGTSLNAAPGREMSALSFEVLKRNLGPAMAIFADVARNPSYPATEIDREKKITIDAIAQQLNDPNGIANRVRNMIVFGADHPYGRPSFGFASSVAQITPEDLARFHSTYIKPANSALIFAGDITLEEATALARQHFGSWTGAAPAVASVPAPQPLAGKVFLVDKPDAAQTVIMEIAAAPQRKSDEFYAFNLADAVFGGGFQTRLNLNLREDKGYSYGVFSFPTFYSKASIWIASGGVQTNKTKESLVEFVNELKAIAGGKPITEVELADAKGNRVRGYAQEFETLGQLVGQIAGLWSDELPFSELQRLPDETQRATLAAVNAAAQKYATPAKSTLILVGDLSKIEAGIRELNLGDGVVLDAEGRPVRK
jgi:zinc protease